MAKIVSKITGEEVLRGKKWTLEEAKNFISRLPPSVSNLYKISGVPSMLLEGLKIGDLDHILLPRISIDEYVAKSGDNTVIAFFIKNEVNAIEPLREFCENSPGVVLADSGDSSTMENTSIVYVEYDEHPNTKDIDHLVRAVSRIAGIKTTDMSSSFGHVKSRFPYSKGLIDAYFKEKAEKEK